MGDCRSAVGRDVNLRTRVCERSTSLYSNAVNIMLHLTSTLALLVLNCVAQNGGAMMSRVEGSQVSTPLPRNTSTHRPELAIVRKRFSVSKIVAKFFLMEFFSLLLLLEKEDLDT